jgi:mono/diheme cytochrome c family protein
LQDGKELYAIFCTHCHGEKGDGNGVLVQNEKFLGVPSYAADRLPNITEGSIYHVITHGKNLMGSHASQISPEERWKIVNYVLKLRADLAPKAAAPTTDSTQTEA